jgi:glycosyltransferase involved in cell wall biosynthesis
MPLTRPEAPPKLAMIATYPPRRCGIATFTHDLRSAMLGANGEDPQHWPQVVALDHGRGDPRAYPPEVVLRLRRDRQAYRETGAQLAASGAQVVSLQHEFGIFGGPSGRGVLDLIEGLPIPTVTTLHTVLEHPHPLQRSILDALVDRSARVVVMSEAARRRLRSIYAVDEEKLAVVPHGVPRIPQVEPTEARKRLGLPDETTILSFGLLGPAKRLELVIDALAEIRSQAPTARFVILGATHPEVRRRHGEQYRLALMEQIERLGLGERVSFVDRFVESDELIAWIQACDIFVTPYGNAEQASSGTLSLAAAAGRACVSTPYEHATDLLGDGRGALFPFNDVSALAARLAELLTDPAHRAELGARAHAHAESMAWPAVANQYAALFAGVAGAQRVHHPVATRPALAERLPERPGYRLRAPLAGVVRTHLERLDDGRGVMQHAIGLTPDPAHGVCTDDVARALMVNQLHARELTGGVVAAAMRRSLGFLEEAFNRDLGRFRNFRSADGTWLEEVGSEDSHGRALQALGGLLAETREAGLLGRARSLFEAALPAALSFEAIRPRCYALLGCSSAIGRMRLSGLEEAINQIGSSLAEPTMQAPAEWPWPEPVVTYDNGVLPQALIAAGRALDRPHWVALGVDRLGWLLNAQTAPDGHLSPIGNDGWWPRGGSPATLDQQPIEAASLLEAARAALEATSDPRFATDMERAYAWFHGSNDLGLLLAEPLIGACHDGLGPNGVNPNCGAESTLVWLLAAERIRELRRASKTVTKAGQRTAAALAAATLR